jgi:hypothetical protein
MTSQEGQTQYYKTIVFSGISILFYRNNTENISLIMFETVLLFFDNPVNRFCSFGNIRRNTWSVVLILLQSLEIGRKETVRGAGGGGGALPAESSAV